MIAILNPPPRHVCECGCAARAEAKLAEAERKHGALVETILALRVEVERLRALDDGWDEVSRLREENARLRAALREWREAESSPDCVACCTLDAALAGAEP